MEAMGCTVACRGPSRTWGPWCLPLVPTTMSRDCSCLRPLCHLLCDGAAPSRALWVIFGILMACVFAQGWTPAQQHLH